MAWRGGMWFAVNTRALFFSCRQSARKFVSRLSVSFFFSFCRLGICSTNGWHRQALRIRILQGRRTTLRIRTVAGYREGGTNSTTVALNYANSTGLMHNNCSLQHCAAFHHRSSTLKCRRQKKGKIDLKW